MLDHTINQVPDFPSNPIEGAVYFTPPMIGRKSVEWTQLPYEVKEQMLDRRIDRLQSVGVASSMHIAELKTENNTSKIALEEVALLSITDELTQLKNRRGFMFDLEEAIAEAANDPDPRLDLIFVDLDRFKNLNDTQGHGKGDELLKKVADMLETMRLRSKDSLARIGGDEFAILLHTKKEGNTQREDLTEDQAIEGFSARFQENVQLLGEALGSDVTASLGVVKYIRGETSAQLLDRADKLMYKVKHAKGSNR